MMKETFNAEARRAEQGSNYLPAVKKIFNL